MENNEKLMLTAEDVAKSCKLKNPVHIALSGR